MKERSKLFSWLKRRGFFWLGSCIVGLLVGIIKIYQGLVSPLLPRCCRFFPSCSAYAIDSLKKHGVFKGLWFTIRRIGRCRPGVPGGYDPIP